MLWLFFNRFEVNPIHIPKRFNACLIVVVNKKGDLVF